MPKSKGTDMEKFRHSLAHLMAASVLELHPKAKFGIGPVIENGFYYDFDLDKKLKLSDLSKIEKRIKKLIEQSQPFEKKSVNYEEAKKIASDQPFKLELIEELKKEKKPITFYRVGKFNDLCGGSHVESTKDLKKVAFKLNKLAGAYWKGDEKNKMLTRIYGVAFKTQKELDDYLKLQEELEKRDHRKLGKKLDLFSFHQVSPGSPFWHPKGMIIIKELEKHWREVHEANDYQEVSTPILNKKELWEQSGHWQFFRDDMFVLKVEKETYALKPMNCPEATLVYSTKRRSYRDLPIRFSEIGRLFRNEVPGALGGLFRVRQLLMDDAHIFCRPDQVPAEMDGVLKLIKDFYKMFGFKLKMRLSTRPKKAMGDNKFWDQAEKELEKVLKKNKLKYISGEKEGAFYGPKIDVIIEDALKREWQMATLQLDLQLPERFKLKYTDQDGKNQRPVMIHRAIFGTFDRFIAILIENFAGAFPIWLSPVQVHIVTVGSSHTKPAHKLAKELKENKIRVFVDDVNETVGYKIRKAEQHKVPYMLVIGDKEAKGGKLTVRIQGQKKMNQMTKKKFIERVVKEIERKK